MINKIKSDWIIKIVLKYLLVVTSNLSIPNRHIHDLVDHRSTNKRKQMKRELHKNVRQSNFSCNYYIDKILIMFNIYKYGNVNGHPINLFFFFR